MSKERMVYLNMKGELETLSFKDIRQRTGKRITWQRMHEINKHTGESLSNREVYNLIYKYLGKVTIFDFNNMMEWGHLQLYPFFQELALKNGAIDKRQNQKVKA